MSYVLPFSSLLHMKGAQTLFGSTGVAAAGSAGLTVSDGVGIATAILAAIGIYLTIAANNVKRRQNYNAEIAAAKKDATDAANQRWQDRFDSLAREHATELAALRRDNRNGRNDLIRSLKSSNAQIEFYRNAYRQVLQTGAGAPVVQLPPLPPAAPDFEDDDDDEATS